MLTCVVMMMSSHVDSKGENCSPCDFKTMVSNYDTGGDNGQFYCDRQHFNALMPEQDLIEYYLPAFRAVIESNSSSSVMWYVISHTHIYRGYFACSS